MELANYGEYSGAPSESQTYEYAKTILKLMTEGPPRSDGMAFSLLIPHNLIHSITSFQIIRKQRQKNR